LEEPKAKDEFAIHLDKLFGKFAILLSRLSEVTADGQNT
jgi:hypothetical protein